MFMNMFGSNKDRRKISQTEPLKGEGSQSFGMINQVKLFLDWKHDFGKVFSLYTAYTHLAYAEHSEADSTNWIVDKKYYEWFDKKSSYGELTIRPSVQLGIVNIYTEQNVVILAFKSELVIPGEWTWWDTKESDELRSNYHSSYGVSIEKEAVDNFAIGGTISTDLANKRFLNRMTSHRITGESLGSWGLYQFTINVKTRYNPHPWFSIAGNYGIEFVTNKNIGYHRIGDYTEVKGAFFFGGVHSVFLW
jgi:hypothetical protein